MNKKTAKKIAELQAKNKETHAIRFATEVNGLFYGVQARAKDGVVNFITVPVDQASGFDKISAALRTVQAKPAEVLAQLQEKFVPLAVEFGITGSKVNKNDETVDIYGFKSASIEGVDAAKIVTVANRKELKAKDINLELMTVEYVMPEAVAENVEFMRSEEGRAMSVAAGKAGAEAAKEAE